MLAVAVAAAVLASPAARPVLTTYPAPSGAAAAGLLSDRFTVSVQQSQQQHRSATVYASDSATRCSQIPPAHNKGECWCTAGRTQAWAAWWFAGAPVTVTVVSRVGWGGDEAWGEVRLRPQSVARLAPLTRLNETALSFVLPPPRPGSPHAGGYKLSLESAPQLSPPTASPCEGYPRTVAHSLMLFGEPSSLAPDPTSGAPVAAVQPGLLYYPPGIHDLGGQLRIPTAVTRVYVAGGAWLRGGFITTPGRSGNGSLVIAGRGVVSGSAQPFLKDPAGFGPCQYNASSWCWSLVNLDQGTGHTVEGLTLHDPPKYFFRSYAADVSVRGVKMLGAWTPNSDGVVTGPRGHVAHSFVRSCDDSIKLFASEMEVHDSTVWQMGNGAVFQLGWWASHSQHGIRVSNVTILHAEWRAVPESWASRAFPVLCGPL